uniref:Uncharacterized protein n=1 Tax=Vespula pensylvanica TaxID=30213 RepID=A0A834P7X7_VESPE|nr:hypothetical protein H0235_004653 [Vespula pensylvanica]
MQTPDVRSLVQTRQVGSQEGGGTRGEECATQKRGHEFQLCDFRVTFGSPKTMSQITRTLLYRTTCLGHIRRITQQDQRGGSRGISISPEPLALALPINEAN